MSVCPSVRLTRTRPGSGLIIVVDEPIAADCILSLHTLLWMDVILYDHFRLKYAKLVTMTSQESSITSQNSHRIVTLHHSHISLICVLSPPVLRSIRAYPLLCPRLIQFLPPPPLSAAAATILSSPVCVASVYRQPQHCHCLARPHDQDHALTLPRAHPASTRAPQPR